MSKGNLFVGLSCTICGRLVRQSDAALRRQDVDPRSNQFLQALAWHWKCAEEASEAKAP